MPIKRSALSFCPDQSRVPIDRVILPVDFDQPVRTMPKKHSPPKSSVENPALPARLKKVAGAEHEKSFNGGPRPPAATRGTIAPVANPPGRLRPSGMGTTVPAEAAMSFLRDTKGSLNWSVRDLTRTLNISREEAERVIALLQIQGYVQPDAHKSGEWITTPSGETVSGAKAPRFDRGTVEKALAALRPRLEETNKDRAAKYKIMRAVAFGDFLVKDRSRVQAAEVGVELARKVDGAHSAENAIVNSAVEAREEEKFLRQLRGRSALIHVKPYSEWMGMRAHQKIV